MKKSVFSALLLCNVFFAVYAAPAANQANTPSHTLKTFFTAMAKSDFAAAKKYVKARELQQMIGALEKLTKEIPDLKADTAKEYAPMLRAQYLSEKITGNKAVVKISYQEKKKIKKETYKLEKIGTRWIITE